MLSGSPMLKECSLAMWFSRDDLETARGADFNKRKKTSADIITVSTALQSFGLRPEVPSWTRRQDPYGVPVVAEGGEQHPPPWARGMLKCEETRSGHGLCLSADSSASSHRGAGGGGCVEGGRASANQHSD